MAETSSRPLDGRSVVVTRAPEQAGDLVTRLEALGAEVLLLPAVSFAEPEDTAALDEALRNLGSFDWVLLTSQNAVRFFCQRLRAVRGHVLADAKYAAVGPSTARAATEEGLRVDYVASRALGTALARELAPHVSGKRVLLPRSDRARQGLAETLRGAGAVVVDVTAYRTIAPEAADRGVLEKIQQGQADVLTFASPSAFHNFAEELGPDAMQRIVSHTVLATIGPVTAGAIRSAGLPVAIEAAESTGAGLAAAIAGYFEQKSPTGARTP